MLTDWWMDGRTKHIRIDSPQIKNSIFKLTKLNITNLSTAQARPFFKQDDEIAKDTVVKTDLGTFTVNTKRAGDLSNLRGKPFLIFKPSVQLSAILCTLTQLHPGMLNINKCRKAWGVIRIKEGVRTDHFALFKLSCVVDRWYDHSLDSFFFCESGVVKEKFFKKFSLP